MKPLKKKMHYNFKQAYYHRPFVKALMIETTFKNKISE